MCYLSWNDKKNGGRVLWKIKKSLFILFSLFFVLGITSTTKVLADDTGAISDQNPNIAVTRAYTGEVTPFKTRYGNSGYTKIELYGHG